MREIKFRAWYDGRMYKESMCEYLSGYGCMFDWFTKPDAPLMQYTGLKDKNGVEIYEGDILLKSPIGYKNNDTEVGEISVINGNTYLVYCENDKQLLSTIINSTMSLVFIEVEVIGNIYENPELLEVK